MEKKIWIVHTGTKDFEKIDMDLKKHIVLKPRRPIQLPLNIALKYIAYNTIEICNNPQEYFVNQAFNRLIIRDAGIGDLLLLEPVIRKLSENSETITLMTRFPEVLKHNPYIDDQITMNDKAELPDNVNVTDWDVYDDLRSYSETCDRRDIEHRTDCYNQVYGLHIPDKEPRIYFDRKETTVFKKKKGMNYIGVACDGSHYYRRYHKGKELIELLLKDKSNTVVVLGDGWRDGTGYIKGLKKDKRIINLQGKTNIRQVINIIKDLDYMICVDTGLMHIALTLHIPTVCIFSIIAPELRVQYYTGQKEIIYKDDLDCIGCGSWHMARCKHGKSKEYTDDFIPPCLNLAPLMILEKMKKMTAEVNKRTYWINEQEKKKEVVYNKPKLNIINPPKKLVMPIIVLNEEKNLPRFVELVMKHPSIGKVIAIDGGSNDNTVAILEKTGAYVYNHYYDVNYHDMQALQRNISCSFVRDGTKIIIMDIDECFSDELYEYLPVLAESKIDYGLLSRRTFDFFDDIGDPTKQIKDYPDYQPRFFTWQKHFKWVASPHHAIHNTPDPEYIQKDIVHFEKENKDRPALEAKWAVMDKKTKEVYA